LPKRFASLIPKLKASDYDYIIFDMPPVSPTSVTARLAGFMDTVMLVVESEKTTQQVVLQANALLAQSKANVTVVLNKTRQYIPARLHKDFLYDV
jgi:Mrp family chromosome partitioning ATPase